MNIFGKLKEKGLYTVSEWFYSRVADWESWYKGDVKGFHHYKVYTGRASVQCQRFTMNMGKKVAEDWANLLMNEKVAVTLEGKAEQDFFDTVCRENNFAVKINEMQELKSGLGTTAYVARVTEATVEESTGRLTGGGGIHLDYVSAPNIFPLSWENGKVNECAFSSSRVVQGKKYLYLQTHRKDEKGLYYIENSLFKDQNGELTEVELDGVEGFEHVPPLVHLGMDRPLFVLDRLNIVNKEDHTLPMGVPAFANAIDQLKGVDIAYDSYVNEFVLGKKRVMVSPTAVTTLYGEPVFDKNDVVFYVLPEDVQGGSSVITPIDMNLRTAEHNAGMQDMLNVLSSLCGFGENHYKYNNGSIATATQVVSENSTLFRTLKKHEIILESVLKELARIILRLGNAVLGLNLQEDVEISVDFDDSIIEDTQSEFVRDMQMVDAGAMNLWEFRAKWMNEDEATAKASLPGMEDLTDESEDEIE